MKHLVTFLFLAIFITAAKAQSFDPNKYIIENEKNIAKEQPAPHQGGG
ncbi:MAG: cupin domain-containing protein, partial [Pedobacter sp.]